MRQDEVKVRYRVPEGRQLTKMKKKAGVTHVYIGKPVDGRQEGYRIQVDSKVVAIDQLVDYLAESRSVCSLAGFLSLPQPARESPIIIARIPASITFLFFINKSSLNDCISVIHYGSRNLFIARRKWLQPGNYG